MRMLVSAILAVVMAGSASGREARYVQSGCEISESYFAYISMTAESEVGKPDARKYSVEFNPERLIVRFRPAYYALKWDDTVIVVAYRNANSDEATLSLRNAGFSENGRTRAIGEMHRDCWDKVKGYISRHVQGPVHIVETIAGI